MTEDQLTQSHTVPDCKRLATVNCAVVRLLHDAVYPSNTVESPATIKLRSILKMPEVTKILQGEKLPTESEWTENPRLMPAVHMYGRLAYKFEGMTDMINCAFMEDLSNFSTRQREINAIANLSTRLTLSLRK